MAVNIHSNPTTKDAKNDVFNNEASIEKAAGSRLYTNDGDDYIDLSSQSAYQLIGHNIKEVQDAIIEATKNGEQLSNLQYSNQKVIELSNKLLEKLADQTQWHIFFTQSDAEAIDLAIRQIYDFWHAKHENQRRIFLTFAYANHSTATSCINLNASFKNHNPYEDFLIPVEHLPYPDTWHLDQNIERKEEIALKRLDEYLEKNHLRCAGLIAEPLLQTHDGMQACRPNFLNQAFRLVKSYRLPIIADERYLSPMRSGRFLACQYLNTAPDIIVMGNNLTNNTIPLGTIITDTRIMDQLNLKQGHKDRINHLACIAASKTIDILSNRLNNDYITRLQDVHAKRLRQLHKQPIVKNIRYLGSIGAFDIICEDRSKQAQLIDWFYKSSTDKKLLIQRHEKNVCISPPLCLTIDDLEQSYDIIEDIMQNMPLQYITNCVDNDAL